ncbi:MAG: hypothetical protein ACE5DM_00665 [Candidatus Nanoarchaeia archaeon]
MNKKAIVMVAIALLLLAVILMACQRDASGEAFRFRRHSIEKKSLEKTSSGTNIEHRTAAEQAIANKTQKTSTAGTLESGTTGSNAAAGTLE